MDKETKLKGFLKEQVNPIFERLVVDILIDHPKDIVITLCRYDEETLSARASPWGARVAAITYSE